jgi:CheY-like chemotaxis protein
MTTVLIVDDDPDIRDLLTQLLQDAGYAVYTPG